MSMSDPNSTLTTEELAKIAGFNRTIADDLDAAFGDTTGLVPTTRTISAGTGLSGGGDLSANRTLALANTTVIPGSYTLLNAIIDAQGRITSASNGSAAPTTFISVKQAPYSAYGDGTHDDTAACRAAIAAAIAAALPVYFPPGTYYFNDTAGTPIVSVTGSNVLIFGAGWNSIIKFRSSAVGIPSYALQLTGGDRNVIIQDMAFQGDNDDDGNTNFWAGVNVLDDVIGISVVRCKFTQCTPLQCADSYKTRSLHFNHNYISNAPNALHPCSDATVFDNDFINDSVVLTRNEFIYSFGQQTNLQIINNRFKNGTAQDIQIRAGQPRFNERHDFRVIGNNFENSRGYSIWIGSDDHPDIGYAVISNNTFRNCNSPINAQGLSSGVISNNHLSFDWEYPVALLGSGIGIGVSGAQDLPGHYSLGKGVIVSNNKLIIRHPWVGFLTIDTQPADGDTVTVGDFVYTWRTTPTLEGEVQRNASTTTCAENFTASIRGLDGRATAPCNVLRSTLDAFNNLFAVQNGETNGNQVVIVSYQTYTFSKTGTHVTLTAPADYRSACATPISVQTTIAPKINDNHMEDFATGIVIQQCLEPSITDNTLTANGDATHGVGSVAPVQGIGNIRSYYRGNRMVQKNRAKGSGGGFYAYISDFAPVVEDDYVVDQQMTVPAMMGRSGVVPVGNGKAHAYFYYGKEVYSGTTFMSLRPYRWDDGDEVAMWDGATATYFHFKRTAPGAAEFNDADSLIALINGIAGTPFTATYETLINNLAGTLPKLLIKIEVNAGGTAGNAAFVQFARYLTPTNWSGSAISSRVQQPLITAQVFCNWTNDTNYRGFCYGGAATLIKTFVHTPLANPSRGAFVQGVDATSHALAPKVYAADIIPGVGFYITHTAAAGTESFFWRAN